MVISSLVVETLPEHTDAVARELTRIEGVEVHETQGCKLVVTVEASSSRASHAVASSFVGVEGVTNVNLVYVNFEDETLGADGGAAGATEGAAAAGAADAPGATD
ncbi:chaperone NapD [Eggerthellaceae bacterium zg-1084]|uniref:Chaperone NapD n=1 Tax=Berryella wangjianweii TaxID=2734634 RepID=A0A6M8J0H7_9ACTN|nr:chaperone NapD [Berryella wangjianweii]NPD30396.1 chaperone NapD [Berryella wangjianweii]QKF07077.1 chaperone NapD [Berryella wangjianweii]